MFLGYSRKLFFWLGQAQEWIRRKTAQYMSIVFH